MRRAKSKKTPASFWGTLLKVLVIVIFAASLLLAIKTLNTADEDTSHGAFIQYQQRFEEHVTAAHWKWRAVQPATMIMLVHYDSNGQETNRSPVKMSAKGWPAAEQSSLGCEKIWAALVALPLQVDGFNIRADYFAPDGNDEERYWCRYSLTSGPYFDYFPERGDVVASEK